MTGSSLHVVGEVVRSIRQPEIYVALSLRSRRPVQHEIWGKTVVEVVSAVDGRRRVEALDSPDRGRFDTRDAVSRDSLSESLTQRLHEAQLGHDSAAFF